MEEHLFGVASDVDELHNGGAIAGEAWRFAVRAAVNAALAAGREAGEALLAGSAEAGETGDDVVPRNDVSHELTYSLNDAGAFVSKDGAGVG